MIENNNYLQKFKKVLEAFRTTVDNAESKKRYNNSTYLPEKAQEENRKLIAVVKSAKREAKQQLCNIQNQIAKDLYRFSFPTVKQIESDDYKLLCSGLLDEKQLKAVLQLHDNEAAFILKSEQLANEYDNWTLKLPTAQDKLEGYSKFYERALEGLEHIEARDNMFNPSTYATTENTAENLASLVGDGSELTGCANWSHIGTLRHYTVDIDPVEDYCN